MNITTHKYDTKVPSACLPVDQAMNLSVSVAAG